MLFTVTAAGGAANGQVAVFDFKTGERKTLIRGGTQAEYVESSTGTTRQGYLIYASGEALYAVRFNLASLEVVGDPVLVVDRVMTYRAGAANFSVSRDGTLVYAPAQSGDGRSLVWVTRQGTEEPLAAPARAYTQPRLSPDGKRVAVSTSDRESRHRHLEPLIRDLDIVDFRSRGGNLSRLDARRSAPDLQLHT